MKVATFCAISSHERSEPQPPKLHVYPVHSATETFIGVFNANVKDVITNLKRKQDSKLFRPIIGCQVAANINHADHKTKGDSLYLES